MGWRNGWWACSTGLTACAHGHVINTTGFCILVQVMPRIYLHTEEDIYNIYSGSELIRHKREPISTLIVALLRNCPKVLKAEDPLSIPSPTIQVIREKGPTMDKDIKIDTPVAKDT
ncbi:hypothetical protein E2320_022619, partial [Naja naja]